MQTVCKIVVQQSLKWVEYGALGHAEYINLESKPSPTGMARIAQIARIGKLGHVDCIGLNTKSPGAAVVTARGKIWWLGQAICTDIQTGTT